MCCDEDTSVWQLDEGCTASVLYEIFCWLSGEELARVGAVCRLWRRSASEPALWRRLLLRCNSADTEATRALRDVIIDPSQWRQEYVNAHAPWVTVGGLQVGSGYVLQHAALSPDGSRLAITTDDATLFIWELLEEAWKESWQCDLGALRGWASAARSDWAECSSRLLVAGACALVDIATRWELLVFDFDEQCKGHMKSRARCGAGAAGCWARSDGSCFLSLEPALLTPGLSYTTVWLNAATQETDSEYTGVRTRLLRIFNEDNAHVLQTLVMDDSSDDMVPSTSRAATYVHATRWYSGHFVSEQSVQRLLLASWGNKNRGGLSAWSIPTSLKRVEARSGGELADRFAARREQLRDPPPDPPPPTEEELRALCDPPKATCDLYSRPLGIVEHPGRKCVWVTTSSGAVYCVHIPTLEPLQVLIPAQLTLHTDSFSHYVQPAASTHYVATPAGSLSGAVHVWSTTCRSHAQPPLRAPAPAVAALLPARPAPALLVVAGDTVHMWRNRATIQSAPDTY
ncbi:uncharacterized protein LOC105842097 isoform X1 [Bombyx mori]|uniref:F-box domain-containing protein n=1 Tax=Bombyx mori TaxID=7091 RepID=A0A8R2C7M2_BOMMO|nr:uncharacterized protein LOC105842097 [Bombyx mori]